LCEISPARIAEISTKVSEGIFMFTLYITDLMLSRTRKINSDISPNFP